MRRLLVKLSWLREIAESNRRADMILAEAASQTETQRQRLRRLELQSEAYRIARLRELRQRREG